MTLTREGIDLIKGFEGCRLSVYKDVGGLLTVGYGHRTPLLQYTRITQEQADTFLADDLANVCKQVANVLKVQLNDNQYSALVSFTFNLGIGTLLNSTLLKLINKNDLEDASKEFIKWCHVGKVEMSGLLLRRQAEQALFEKSIS